MHIHGDTVVCIRLFKQHLDYDGAKGECDQETDNKGRLFMADSKDKLAIIGKVHDLDIGLGSAVDKEYLIGLHDGYGSPGVYRWSDGNDADKNILSFLMVTSWFPGMTYGTGVSCVAINNNLELQVGDCTSTRKFVCEIPL